MGLSQSAANSTHRAKELDGPESNNRGIAGELILRRAEKFKARFGDDVRIGRFAGFDLFLRPSFNDTIEMVVRGKNSSSARVTDTALGTIRSLRRRFRDLMNARKSWRKTSLMPASAPRSLAKKSAQSLARGPLSGTDPSSE